MPTDLLKSIDSPRDIKKISVDQLPQLASEIRQFMIKTISKNGGHLAPNLGVVELTIALHYIYNSPKDKIIFDVGHQAYTHKILTGRREAFKTIRKLGGISGYLKLTESKHDVFGAGHVGTAVSAAVGFAQAREIKKEKNEVIAVIGDGSLTNGLTYEGINNIGERNFNITVVLNDNKYSISKNVGGIAKYLEKLSTIHISEDPKTDFESIFHALGFRYIGPVDGHNFNELLAAFGLAKQIKGPKLVHVLTRKGMGYEFSENNPSQFHFTNPFVLESGKLSKDTKNLTYSKCFSKALIRIAEKDKRVVAITAAMPAGTGLDIFAKKFPERFIDVGIAESHAVVEAGGLALSGLKPVFAVYSSFLQRSYDQIIHDIALQKIPVIFSIDRAGIVGNDGPTHHGLFDLSYLRTIPNMSVWAPKDENELGHMLYTAVKFARGPIAIRYPRGCGYGLKIDRKFHRIKFATAEKLTDGKDIAILAIGSMVYLALEAADNLKKQGINATVYNARSVKPIDKNMILDAAKIGNIITVEENVLAGGFGSAILEELEKTGLINSIKIKTIGIEKFVEHGDVDELKNKYGLTSARITKESIKLLEKY